ncbi:MAG: STAS/SEC14 domain-containing protein [Eudoraea sp.]|nr:STAS/SEC14 domain-containing protein [Eudoraea sp.]
MLTRSVFTGNNIGYILDGVMDMKSLNNFWYEILEKLASHEKVNLYVEDENLDSFTLNIILIVTLFPLEYADKFDKIVFVAPGKKHNALEKLKRILKRVTIKNFEVKDRQYARKWLISS